MNTMRIKRSKEELLKEQEHLIYGNCGRPKPTTPLTVPTEKLNDWNFYIETHEGIVHRENYYTLREWIAEHFNLMFLAGVFGTINNVNYEMGKCDINWDWNYMI